VTGTAGSILLLPAVLLCVALAGPLGLAPAAVGYERLHALASSLPGRALVVALVVSCLWNGAHHLRHFLIDLGGRSRDTASALALYVLAGAGSLLAVVAAVRL
jgi:fumarate reductase subunit D